MANVFSGDDDDQMSQIFTKLRNFDVFEPLDPNAHAMSSNSNQKNITSETEQKWRLIHSSGNNEKDKQDTILQGDGKLSNIKVHKKNLNSYLRKHYTPRLASKLTSLFNWQNQPVGATDFYLAVEALLLINQSPRETEKVIGPVDHLRQLKKFAF